MYTTNFYLFMKAVLMLQQMWKIKSTAHSSRIFFVMLLKGPITNGILVIAGMVRDTATFIGVSFFICESYMYVFLHLVQEMNSKRCLVTQLPVMRTMLFVSRNGASEANATSHIASAEFRGPLLLKESLQTNGTPLQYDEQNIDDLQIQKEGKLIQVRSLVTPLEMEV